MAIDKFDRKNGNNKSYKSVRVDIDPETGLRAVISKNITPVDKKYLKKGLFKGIKRKDK